MAQSKSCDLDLTCENSQALDLFDSAITAYLASSNEVPEIMQALLAADEKMPMAFILQVYLMKLAAHPNLAATIEEMASRARDLPMNTREEMHLQAMQAWLAGHSDQTLKILEELTDQWPTDIIALRIAHYLHFYNGSGADMAKSTGKALASWAQDHPHYSYLQGMHGFGLEEAGEYRAARRILEQALQTNRNDLWSVHALDHAFYMQGEHVQGLSWLREFLDLLPGANNFGNHIVWHEALHHFAMGDFDAVLSIYDERLEATVKDDFYLDMCNNAALLWRLEESGVDVGERWLKLAEHADQHTDDQELLFASLHYALPLIRTAPSAFAKLTSTFEHWAASSTHQGDVCRDLGLSLLHSMQDSRLRPETVHDLAAIGGSKAQRELFLAPAV